MYFISFCTDSFLVFSLLFPYAYALSALDAAVHDGVWEWDGHLPIRLSFGISLRDDHDNDVG